MISEGTGYVLETTDSRVVLYRHTSSGIKVWHQAVWLAPPKASRLEVYFHYTSWDVLESVASAVLLDAEVLRMLLRPMPADSGKEGIYVAVREPEQMTEMLESLPWWVTMQEFCIP